MLNPYRIYIVVCLFIIAFQLKAQYNLEFVENKGQWNKQVRYKGELNFGAVFLTQDGFKILLHHPDDMQALAEKFHLDRHSKNGGGGGGEIETNAISHNNHSTSTYDEPVINIRSHAYELKFLGANKEVQIEGDKQAPGYNNYILGNNPSNWFGYCKIFQAIQYKNLYKNIDIRYYTSNNQVKYDIIVHPGGNIHQIIAQYNGVTQLAVQKKQLIIKTSVGEIKEDKPFAFQIINGIKKEIECDYVVKGNLVQYKVGADYNPNATLIIDPSLIFSTFSGSQSDNWGYTATYDNQGNFYAGGIVFGGNFPVSTGAFQTTFGGGTNTGEGSGFDIGILKLNPNGSQRIYATFIGGSGNEQPHSLVVDGAGNLIIAGRTLSANYPVFPIGRPTVGTGGDWDIVVTKLNAAGSGLIGSIKIGGSGPDGVNIRPKYTAPTGTESTRRNYGDDARSEVILDAGGNIYVASSTQSVNYPSTPNSFQPNRGATNGSTGRFQDGVVLKLDPNLTNVLFNSFLGGSDDDAAFVLSLNPSNGDLYVGGATASSNFPGNKTGSIFPNYQGGTCDGFLAIISNDGSTLRRVSYFGTNGADAVYGVQFDRLGFPYIMGTTTGSWPVVNANFSQAGGKQFIAKLQPDLSAWVYSTIFGTNSSIPNISPIAFLVDRCENVYISGWGGSINSGQNYQSAGTNGLSVTNDAISRTTDGSDMYFFVLAKNAVSQLYGSFFGQAGGLGEHVDGGTSRFDVNGVIYQAICANCGSAPKPAFPTTPGVWSPTNGSTDCNLAAVKIAFNLAGVGAGVRATINGVIDTSGCVPLTVNFTDTLAQGRTYRWLFNDGTPERTTTSPSISHTFNLIGTYRVRLIAEDPNACNERDTSYVTVRVRNDDAALNFTNTKLPPCENLTFRFTNNSTAPPGKPFGSQSFRWNFGDGSTLVSGPEPVTHTYTAPGTYNVKLILNDTNYCNAPDSVTIPLSIAANVEARFSTPAFGCAPYTARFTNTSLGGQTFFWDFGDGSTSTATNPTHFYPNVGTYTVRLTANDPNTCNLTDDTTFTITVSPLPTSVFSYSPQPPQPNMAISFTNNSLGATYYKWIFGDGDSLMTFRRDTIVRHIYNETRVFNACLVAYNEFGCADTSCVSIDSKVEPLADVPNAFSPNGDGKNDVLYVRGFGIGKMLFRIYNRWGVLVFETADRTKGWDGRYKGAIQAQDVYHYTLDIEFTDGQRFRKSGDITLLR